MKKSIFYVLLLFFSLCFSVAQAGTSTDVINYQGKKLSYAYYIPSSTSNPSSALILVPGLKKSGQSMITQKWKDLAEEKKWLLISPSFVFEGGKAFSARQSYQYPEYWSGGALNAIFESFKSKGINLNQFYLAGFSAGAQFVGRYAFLYPNKIVKVAMISSGGNDPITKNVSIKFFYGIGGKDTSDRKYYAKTFAEEASRHNISVVSKTYANAGHKFTEEMQRDVIDFLK